MMINSSPGCGAIAFSTLPNPLKGGLFQFPYNTHLTKVLRYVIVQILLMYSPLTWMLGWLALRRGRDFLVLWRFLQWRLILWNREFTT
jgi:hypothetical protein